jgi:hypothetical protein
MKIMLAHQRHHHQQQQQREAEKANMTHRVVNDPHETYRFKQQQQP